MSKIKNYILNKWDWFVCKLARNSLKRICDKNPCMAYLIELQIKNYREKNPIPKSLEEATKSFYEELHNR